MSHAPRRALAVDDGAPTVVASPRARRATAVSPLTLVGVALLLVGVVSLGWVGWQYFGTNITSNNAIGHEREKLRDTWATPAVVAASATPMEGDALALLRIPQLGADYEYPVMAGVGEDTLARGIGWYPTSALPGDVGNFAVAGHRITHGEPFARLLELKVGATVVVETRSDIFTYQLTSSPAELTVSDTDTWVLDAVPGKPAGTQPTERLMTLTTCTDLFASPKRSVAFAKLVETHHKG